MTKVIATVKKLGVWILAVAGAGLVLFGLIIVYLTITEYKPKDTEPLEVVGRGGETISLGQELSVMIWNLGYGALGEQADFFMDGGKMVRASSKEQVQENMNAITSHINEIDPDILLLQEVDRDSHRSYRVNEDEWLRERLEGYESSFAYNYKVSFVPYPIPPLGRVESGIETFSRFLSEESYRQSLPCSFGYPERVGNLKRGLLINKIPIEGTDKKLVIVNLHLEAYDSGEGKIAQTTALKELLEKEVSQGNYVIAGGDFNQTFFPTDFEVYPIREENWIPGAIDVETFDDNLKFLNDTSAPTCRFLNKPYIDALKDDFQYYMLDGFVISDNLKLEEIKTESLDFKYSDHNPVLLKVTIF